MSHKELARFSAGGKTFFFNEMRAKNDARYLSINAIWGQGNKQRMTLFVPQLLDYARCLDEAIASITGMTRNIGNSGGSGITGCRCGAEKTDIRAAETQDHKHWVLMCRVCGIEVDSSSEDAFTEVSLEMGW